MSFSPLFEKRRFSLLIVLFALFGSTVFGQIHIVPISATTTAGEFGVGTEIENIFNQATGATDPLTVSYTNTCFVGASEAYISGSGITYGILTIGIPMSDIDALHVWNGWSTACELNHSLNNINLNFYSSGTLIGSESLTVPMPDGSGFGFVVPFGSIYEDVDEVTLEAVSLHGGNEIGIIELGFRPAEVIDCDDLVPTVPVTEVCIGEEITLSAESINGGEITWDGGVTDGVPFTPPLGVTTYTATSDSDLDCEYEVEITVHDLPEIVATVDEDEICLGDAVILTGAGGITYAWEDGIMDGEPFAPIASGVNTFTVTGTDINGCENTATIDVNVLAPPPVDAGEDVYVCEGGAVVLSGDGAGVGGTYTWDGGVIDGVEFTPATGGTYTVTGTTTDGCSATDEVEVILTEDVIVEAGEDFEVCEGELFTLMGDGAGPGATYAWDGGAVDGEAFAIDATTTFTVVGTAVGGCIGTDDITVTVHPLPSINAGEDIQICDGESVTLSGSGLEPGAVYVWDGGVFDGVSFVPATTTVYTVTGESEFGCENSDMVLVTVIPNPVISAGLPKTICAGDAVTLTGSGAGVGGTYTWDGGVMNGVPFNPGSSSTYTVTGTTTDGCYSTSSVTVTVNPLPNVVFTGFPTKGCNPHTVNFSTSTPGTDYFWKFGDGSTSTSMAPNHLYTKAGLYDIELTVTSTDGCVNSKVFSDTIEVFEQPIADFTFQPMDADILDTEINFVNHSSFADEYEWTFGDGTPKTSEINPTHFYPEVGNVNYQVILVAANDFGCADTIIKPVKINDLLIYYLPNTFTPDGNSFNDEFRPYFHAGLDVYDFHMMVFNRWGEMVFESFNATGGWDGTYGGGDIVPDGVYIWRMEFGETMTDKKHKVAGHVTVIR